MESKEIREVVSRDPGIMSGELVFAGTRVPVRTLVDYLAAGDSLEYFLEAIPTVSRVQAVAYLEMTPEAIAEAAGYAEGERPRKPRGTPRERRVDVGPGEPAADAVSEGRGGRETLSEALARVRERQAEEVGIPEKKAVKLPAGKGLSDQLLEDRHARDY